jgi:23S rRNA pseudouridine955/2504/2580 synthase
MPACHRAERQKTFGELNRRRCLRSLCKTCDADDAILSAQYDGLDMEDQLTCGASGLHLCIRQVANRSRSIADGTFEYTPKDFVETMSYSEVHASKQQTAVQSPAVRHLTVTGEQAGQRLDNFLMKMLEGLPRNMIYRVIRKGEVRVNGHRAGPDTRLQANDRVRVPPVRERETPAVPAPGAALLERLQAAIFYEDAHVLALDKPAGVAVHGGSGISFGVIEGLRTLRPGESLELIHRLDRDTSGCLLVARDASTLRQMHALMREGRSDKRYLTLVRGKWDLGQKRIDVPLRTDLRVGGERTVRADPSGKPSVSEFRPVQFFGKRATLMEVSLLTGRTHQIRVHALHAGHPVAGDEKYGDAAFNTTLRGLGLKRMFLHAHSLAMPWPEGREFNVNTPLPADLATLLDQLGQQPRRRGGQGT